ncbi:hypothetical protein B0H17DRAFT_1126490 [Mycena rosella]|uniref:Uncharacterized protein n=1 Tax=Mycena rosella TaxID=1033263 RepID=A0AAD7GTB2_MYCRO|nr:hypothetical protein B0H17DRAFT_1126490 [Mycena rosella]
MSPTLKPEGSFIIRNIILNTVRNMFNMVGQSAGRINILLKSYPQLVRHPTQGQQPVIHPVGGKLGRQFICQVFDIGQCCREILGVITHHLGISPRVWDPRGCVILRLAMPGYDHGGCTADLFYTEVSRLKPCQQSRPASNNVRTSTKAAWCIYCLRPLNVYKFSVQVSMALAIG